MKLLVNLCSYLGYGMLWGVSFLPLPVMYLMTDVLFVILFYGVHYRRKVVDMNLRNSFPEKSEEERKRIARKYYRHLCDTFAEFYKLWHITEDEIKRRCVMVNVDVPHRYFEQGRSVIAFSGHYGNWEMMYSYKLWEKNVELVPIYKPIHNKIFDRMTCKIRSRFGATPLAKADIFPLSFVKITTRLSYSPIGTVFSTIPVNFTNSCIRVLPHNNAFFRYVLFFLYIPEP